MPLFQEQAIKIAIVGAGFSPGRRPAPPLHGDLQAHRLGVGKFKTDFIDGMLGNGYQREFAEACFKQIESATQRSTASKSAMWTSTSPRNGPTVTGSSTPPLKPQGG